MQLPRPRLLAHGRGDAVGGEDDDRAFRHVVGVVDEDRATLGEGLHDVHVVHDLLADVDGGAVLLERALDGLDGPVDACAVAAGLGHQDSLGGHVFEGTWARPCPAERDVPILVRVGQLDTPASRGEHGSGCRIAGAAGGMDRA